ncbi:signal transduction histidine kinase [Mucilaginibacter rubeus]|uniref:sensor histidine kinase n=1 Tax=Mucilaginibacter rubeus TaxID=2027860 RepID=UPI003396BAC7
MKKRLKFIILIAGSVAVMITACQLYWVFYNYQSTRTNFITAVNYALRTSVEEYELRNVKLPTSLQYARPTLTFMTRTIPSQDPVALDTPGSKRRFSAEFSTVAVDSAYLKEMKALVARLKSQQEHRRLQLDTLTRLFQIELVRNHIKEQFRLSVQQGSHPSGAFYFLINNYKDPVVVNATLTDPVAALLRQNLGPAAVSTVLIVLSVAGLVYMWRIIRRQAELDKMKDGFINNISHELKTPLSVLRTSNEALLNFGAADDRESLHRYLSINAHVIDELDSNIDRMVELTISDLSKKQPAYENVNVENLIRTMIDGYIIDPNVNIRFQTDHRLSTVFTDPYMISSILNNLIDNAVKYSGAKARVSVWSQITGEQWQLDVKDQGRGIAADHIPYIFDKFYRVPSGDLHEVKGYGIGLAHVTELVQKLKGKITVSSKLGCGTTFQLTFKV